MRRYVSFKVNLAVTFCYRRVSKGTTMMIICEFDTKRKPPPSFSTFLKRFAMTRVALHDGFPSIRSCCFEPCPRSWSVDHSAAVNPGHLAGHRSLLLVGGNSAVSLLLLLRTARTGGIPVQVYKA